MKKSIIIFSSIIIFIAGLLIGFVLAQKITTSNTPNNPSTILMAPDDTASTPPSQPKPRKDATYVSDDPYILELEATYSDNGSNCWQNSIDQLNTQFDIVFLGDSLTKYNNWQELFPDKNVLNYGYSDATLEDIYYFKNSVIQLNPDYIVIGGGTNRLTKLGDKNIHCYRAMLEAFTQCTYAKIYVQSIPPLTRQGCSLFGYTVQDIQDYNKQLEDLANEYGCTFVDIYSLYADSDGFLNDRDSVDGIHLTEDAYIPWEEAIKQALTNN